MLANRPSQRVWRQRLFPALANLPILKWPRAGYLSRAARGSTDDRKTACGVPSGWCITCPRLPTRAQPQPRHRARDCAILLWAGWVSAIRHRDALPGTRADPLGRGQLCGRRKLTCGALPQGQAARGRGFSALLRGRGSSQCEIGQTRSPSFLINCNALSTSGVSMALTGTLPSVGKMCLRKEAGHCCACCWFSATRPQLVCECV
jgi:hypothetical protein